MKTDLKKHLVPNVELSGLIADYIEKRTQELSQMKNGEGESVSEKLRKMQTIKFQPVMLLSQLEAVQRVMRMHDMRKLVMHGFEKIRCDNGDAVTVFFMPEDMHISHHRGYEIQKLAEIIERRKNNPMSIIPKLSFSDVKKKALMNCVDEVHLESDFVKKTCNTKVKVKFEGQHPVPFYHKGRW